MGRSARRRAAEFYESQPGFNARTQKNAFLAELKATGRFSQAMLRRIERATNYAFTAHGTDYGRISTRDPRLRHNGDPYITHPLAVARAVAESGGREHHIIIALLHDVPELFERDEGKNRAIAHISKEFGESIASSVDLLTQRKPSRNKQANYRNYLTRLLNSGDLAAIWVKLQDASHNLSTLEHLPEEKRMSTLRKYAILHEIAQHLDENITQRIGEYLSHHGMTPELKGVRGRIVTVPPRDNINAALLLRLPRASARAIVLYQASTKQPRRVTVGLPLHQERGITPEFWETQLAAICEKTGTISGFRRVPKRLPTHAGNRAHYELEIPAEKIDALKRQLRAIHKNHFPEWTPS